MFTVWTAPLALVIIGCVTVLIIHGRLAVKYKPVEEGLRILELLLRQRMDLLYDLTAAYLPACVELHQLCEDCRDAEPDILLEGYIQTDGMILALRTLIETEDADNADDVKPVWHAFLKTEKPFAEAALIYDKAAAAYNAAITRFAPIAGLFLMKPAVILSH